MRPLALFVSVVVLAAGCSTGDGRQLAEPDPDLTPVTTAAPTAAGPEARGAPAPEVAIPVSSAGVNGLVVSSPAFEPGATLPVDHTCDGAGRAPQVDWSGNVDDRPLALVVRDADAGGAVHWLVTDLAGPTGRVGGPGTGGGVERDNGFGEAGWTGPCPGDDLEHRYVFALYALGRPLPPDPALDATALVQAIEEDHVEAATTLAVYARS